MRTFETGATRDNDNDKLDYEGFLSPEVLEAYAKYMHKHQIQSDGNLRSSDNWQNGIPKDVYIKSAFRHFMDWWKEHRGLESRDGLEEALGGLLFNIMGYWFEIIQETKDNDTEEQYIKETIDSNADNSNYFAISNEELAESEYVKDGMLYVCPDCYGIMTFVKKPPLLFLHCNKCKSDWLLGIEYPRGSDKYKICNRKFIL